MSTPWAYSDARCDAATIRLSCGQTLNVLRYLVENWGRVIGKDELIKAVWSGLSVTDDALVQCVRDVRHALLRRGSGIIKTVPRRGYLFSVGHPGFAGAPASPLRIRTSILRTEDGVKLAMASIGRACHS